jgi:hypothetical protein
VLSLRAADRGLGGKGLALNMPKQKIYPCEGAGGELVNLRSPWD